MEFNQTDYKQLIHAERRYLISNGWVHAGGWYLIDLGSWGTVSQGLDQNKNWWSHIGFRQSGIQQDEAVAIQKHHDRYSR